MSFIGIFCVCMLEYAASERSHMRSKAEEAVSQRGADGAFYHIFISLSFEMCASCMMV